ncbi:MAG: hypothetical protein COB66_05610 [Coxiella sp. (in: Bacteria)]|nr:MAG: hypothetical protein COB66_05610 [Coxiella sp. (in: g-proteobacteria)]
MKKLAKCIAAGLFFTAATAFAGGPDDLGTPAHVNGIYLGAGGGLAFSGFNASFDSNPFRNDLSLVGFSSTPGVWENSGGAFRALAGWNFLDYFGVEAGYTYYLQHTWEATGTQTITANVGSVKVRMDNSALQLFAKAHYNIERFDISALLGMAYEMNDNFRVTDRATNPDLIISYKNQQYWTFAYGLGVTYYTTWIDGLGVSLDWLGALHRNGIKFTNNSGNTFSYNAPTRNDVILGLRYFINL